MTLPYKQNRNSAANCKFEKTCSAVGASGNVHRKTVEYF